MLNRIVPTCEKTVPAASVFALNAKTSRSGSENETWPSQMRLWMSSQWVPLYWTMIPVSGAAALAAFVLGPSLPPAVLPLGFGQLACVGVPDPAVPNPSRTQVSRIDVLWLPEWNAATYTLVPSVASARGVSAKNVRIRTGVPPNV